MNLHMTETPATPQVITVRMPSRLDLLAVLDRVALSVCERLKFDEDACSQITMSVIEAGTNAIQHGHRRDASKPVDTTFTVFEDRLEISVHDLGPGFNLEDVNGNVTSPEHILDLRGRGIFIMRQCMDSVRFEFSASGTLCLLTKRRPVLREAG
jgi:serine/threonine-protein kinase RsbW